MNHQGKRTKRTFIVGGAACAALVAVAFPGTGHASPARSTAPSLGTAASFAVLGASTVTNTGPTTVNGNLGVSPGTAVTGFPPGIVSGGTIHAGDATALQAQTDTTTAYNNLAGQSCDFNLTGEDLGGKTLIPGTYCFSTSAQLTGALTLNGQGNPNAVFVFQIGSTLTTASNSSVLLINGAQACNVFWQVGSSAILGTTTHFAGNILALASDTLNTGATVAGRALAQTGAVTLDSNQLSASPCALISTATATPGGSPTATSLPATATAIAATGTAIVAATNTAIVATNTALAGATNTAVAAPTSTVIAGVTNTAVAAATNTAVAAATNTAVAAPTATTIAAATNTAIAATTSTAVAAPTATALAAATNTAVAGATSTAIAAATATAVTGVTATSTPKPSKASTPTSTATATQVVTQQPSPTPVPVPSKIPGTGAGGTSGFAGSGLAAPRGAALVTGTRSSGGLPRPNTVSALLPSGGGRTGGSPVSPLAPLAFLAAMALGIHRLKRRAAKR
ncbi:MAG TPA: ice-binding family protein [Chloroflexota bacterium]